MAMRIAHVIQSVSANAGGTTTAFLNLLSAVAVRGNVELVAYTLKPAEGDPFWKAIKGAGVEGGMAALDRVEWRLLSSVGRLRAGELGRTVAADLKGVAGNKKIDALHLHGLWSPDLMHVGLAARRAGTPYLWQSHGMLLRWAMNYKRLKKQVYLRLGLGRALAGARVQVCMTRDELEGSVFPPPPAGVSLERHRVVVPLPVLIAGLGGTTRAELRGRAREKWAIPDGAFTFAFLGRLHPVKRVELTIEAFARARGGLAGRDSRLLLLGSGDEPYVAMLRELCARLGVTDTVIFAGWVGGEGKAAGLCAADTLVLNSSIESFGYVLFEALDAGTPIVMTENLSLAKDFRAAGAAAIAENSVEGLAGAMVAQAARAPDELAEHAAAARAWAARTYHPDTVGAQLESLYREATGDGRQIRRA